jgi:hypothetical protein
MKKIGLVAVAFTFIVGCTAGDGQGEDSEVCDPRERAGAVDGFPVAEGFGSFAYGEDTVVVAGGTLFTTIRVGPADSFRFVWESLREVELPEFNVGHVSWDPGRGVYWAATSRTSEVPSSVYEVDPTSGAVIDDIELDGAVTGPVAADPVSGELLVTVQELSPYDTVPSHLYSLDRQTGTARLLTTDRDPSVDDGISDTDPVPLGERGILFTRGRLGTDGSAPVNVLMWIDSGADRAVAVTTPDLLVTHVTVTRDERYVVIAGFRPEDPGDAGVWVAEIEGRSPDQLEEVDWIRVLTGRVQQLAGTDSGIAIADQGGPAAGATVTLYEVCGPADFT